MAGGVDAAGSKLIHRKIGTVHQSDEEFVAPDVEGVGSVRSREAGSSPCVPVEMQHPPDEPILKYHLTRRWGRWSSVSDGGRNSGQQGKDQQQSHVWLQGIGSVGDYFWQMEGAAYDVLLERAHVILPGGL